jgi:hypothetical protein
MDESNSQVTVLVSTNSASLKTSSVNTNSAYDMVLFVISDAGALLRGKHISLNKNTD